MSRVFADTGKTNKPLRANVRTYDLLKCRERLRALRSAFSALRHEVAEGTGAIAELSSTVARDAEASLHKRYRVSLIEPEKEPATPRQATELLEQFERGAYVPQMDFATALQCLLVENSALREEVSTSRFRTSTLESKLRSADDERKVFICAKKIDRESISKHDSVLVEYKKMLTEKDEAINSLRFQIDSCEQNLQQLRSALQRASTNARTGERDRWDASPRVDDLMISSTFEPSPPDLCLVASDSNNSAVVERIYRRHSESVTKRATMADVLRSAEEESLYRASSDRYEMSSSHHVVVPGEPAPMTHHLLTPTVPDLPFGSPGAEGLTLEVPALRRGSQASPMGLSLTTTGNLKPMQPRRPSVSQGHASPHSPPSRITPIGFSMRQVSPHTASSDLSPLELPLAKASPHQAVAVNLPQLGANAMMVATSPTTIAKSKPTPIRK